MKWAIRFPLGIAGIYLMSALATAMAQERVNVRATIDKVDGQLLTVTSREGTALTIKLADNAAIRGVVRVPLSEVKVGSYLGVSAMPQADGTQRAIAITLFPAGFRPSEGFRPHDLQPGSTMTNAAVETTVAGVEGQILTLKYKDGEQKIVVPGDLSPVTYVAADKTELKPGARIVIFNAVRQQDGTLQAGTINVAREGTAWPM
jgi:hypothetical protein